ncbi:MAG: stage II sporulation protein M [Holdemania massiliensis]
MDQQRGCERLSSSINDRHHQCRTAVFLRVSLLQYFIYAGVFFLGFSLAGIPLIGFVVFTKGVQIGFRVFVCLTYQLKGVLGILLTLIPQILFDLIALFLVSVISTEISYALIQRCLGYSRSDFSLIHLINSRLNVLIVSLLLIFFSAWIKSTLVIRLMEIFAMME